MPSSAQNDAPTTSSIAMPGMMAAASSGVRSCVSTPSERCSSAPARKSAQSRSSRTRKRYPSCTTSSGSPCSSREPEDHRNARERQLDVDAARELVPEPAGARAGRAGGHAVRALEQDDVLDTCGGQVVRRARARRRPPPTTTTSAVAVIRVPGASTAARATIRSSNASPTDLKTVMSSADVRTSAPRTTCARSATTWSRPNAPSPIGMHSSPASANAASRVSTTTRARAIATVSSSRAVGLVAPHGVDVRARRQQASVEQRHVARRARADDVRAGDVVRSTDRRVDAEPTSDLCERLRTSGRPRHDGHVLDRANGEHRLEVGSRLHPRAEDDETTSAGVGEVARGQPRDGGGAERGERGAVHDRVGRLRVRRRTGRRPR